jgi:hypothetical protein
MAYINIVMGSSCPTNDTYHTYRFTKDARRLIGLQEIHIQWTGEAVSAARGALIILASGYFICPHCWSKCQANRCTKPDYHQNQQQDIGST